MHIDSVFFEEFVEILLVDLGGRRVMDDKTIATEVTTQFLSHKFIA